MGDHLTAGPISLNEGMMTAKIVGNSLEVYVPLENEGGKAVKGSAKVTCKHVTGDYQADGSSSFKIEPGGDTVVVKINDAPKLESTGAQAEYVVSYTLELSSGKISGKRSLFMLLDKADLVLIIPDSLIEGQLTNVRALLIDPRSHLPIPDMDITLEVEDNDGVRKTYESTTDEFGVAIVEMPADEVGELKVKAAVVGDGSGGAIETQVQVVRESKLLITTDKPMYQPGQVMHLRALALNRFDKAPLADDDILFEVFDAKGNKVFKRLNTTNSYGIGWAQFQLATQVTLGPYTIKATIGDVVSEKTVTVDRYSLPKFKVDATLDRAFYQPGQIVGGEVDVQYFFGKPVAGGEVKVVVFNYVAEWVPDQEIIGKTNDAGLYVFEYQLPDYLIGQPLEDGKALLMMEITVTDTAEHEQKVARQIIVTSNLLDVVIIPESGTVVPDVWNLFYIFASDPTGAAVAAACDLTVNGADIEEGDDELVIPPYGPAKVALMPHEGVLNIVVAADDGEGNTATRSFDFSVGSGESVILLRTDRALYHVGDTMEVTAWATGGYHHLFLDVIRKNQTVLTHTLELDEGEAKLLIDLDNELTEDLVLDAYLLADSGQFIRDTAVVYVQPANQLDVQITTDKEEYMPGDTAVVQFEVKGEDGGSAQAALGIQVVDEAVYALSEIKPGLLKLYFQLEEELQNPSYQIGPANGFSLGGLIMSGADAEPGSEEDGAIQDTTKAAFAAMGEAPLGQSRFSSFQEALSEAKTALSPYFEEHKEKIRAKLESKLSQKNVSWDQACTFLAEYLAQPRFFDFWEHPYEFSASGDWDCNVTFSSRGPDELLGTDDDWSGSLTLYDLSQTGEWREGQWAMPMAGGGDMDGDFAMEEGEANGPPHDKGTADPSDDDTSGGSDKAAVKVRSWFPETLFVEPSLITDAGGKAQVEILLADSITEWRMTTMANSVAGQLGSRTDGVVVFQDFFVDIDFPKYLTQNDELSFPIAIYNYLPQAQTISVELMSEEWFSLTGADVHEVTLEGGEVSVVYFPVKVTKVGWHKLTVYGMGDTLQDAIQRTVEVKPDGKEIVVTESARFDNDGENPSEDTVTATINFPEGSIEGSQSIVVKVLPGLSTHVVEGMESMLKLPGG